MTHIFLFLWLMSSLFIILERRIVRMFIYLGIFSLITSLCFLFFAAPDVAMAEAAISTFSTIFFIVSFEKYYSLINIDYKNNFARRKKSPALTGQLRYLKRNLVPLGFTVFLTFLFIYFMPNASANPYLKDQYLSMFIHEVGGENSVTAIYLGYRMYDTLFEALMLLVSVVAVIHLSWHKDISAEEGQHSDIKRSNIVSYTIRTICPVILLFGIYLILNGHLTPGGGFQGGVAIAAFFICRYLIYNIYDIQAARIIKMEKVIFAAIIFLPVFFIFFGFYYYLPQYRNIYLMMMNTLIGMKVTCGFIIIFYRYIAFEKR